MTAFTTRPEITGTFGVVTSTHWIGSAVGMSILEKGGNAFDATVATGFTLQIVEPHLNGPGGGVSGKLIFAFMLPNTLTPDSLPSIYHPDGWEKRSAGRQSSPG